ncbi:MAG: leucine--tRNA ligase [Ezakiella sp.]|nr:leucine--tRNA ligase [Ezakiella sp.]MDD7472113.1 leucine--tRNA ligase [Bacillota bacterium]MDY3923728.1 leucine--tRNA ligase [Ezakiella sp.]
MNYDHLAIEKKWQDRWAQTHVFDAVEDYSKKKYYLLVEFPYPSGQGLHVGHPRSYTALDVVARLKRMQGYNVLFPIGFDAFGLPTERFAIKNHMNPEEVTKNNIATFKKQLTSLGISFSWDREINTTEPSYYKWTQWIFLQMYKHNLAYKKEMTINWCPDCKIGLANEEVVDGKCERCGAAVEHRVKNQWMLAITKYADRLVDGLDTVNYIDKVKLQQKNWIGRSYGAEIRFKTTNDDSVLVYTTRPDTIFGATYLVLSPEHEKLKNWNITNREEVEAYQKEARMKSDFERAELNKEKTGIKLEGVTAINPFTNKEIPIFISDYVLTTYGTGAIMSVPAHDTRDFEFAKKFNLPIVEVIKGGNVEEQPYTDTTTGVLVNSGKYDGLSVEEAKEEIIAKVEADGIGNRKTNFKLRDWVFSRQRYWGEPIPMVNCDGKWVMMNEKDLPLTLPHVDSYEPTDSGESPLALLKDFVETTCPNDPTKKGIRETDTMPNWAGSSWYYLRYCDPHNDKELADYKKLQYWLPVDWYNGGMEHTTLHLLYSRFWHKFLYDIGVVPTEEPYMRRTSHGMILGSNGEKMSKSRGNVRNPDEYVKNYGADALRLYEMFLGDYEKSAPWNDDGPKQLRKFIERVVRLLDVTEDGDEIREELVPNFHFTIKKVTNDYLTLKYNTAIAQIMTLVNDIYLTGKITRKEFKILITLLNPVAPHITEELNEKLGYKTMICEGSWPEYDEALTIKDTIEIPVQINGKVVERMIINRDETEENVLNAAMENETVKAKIEGKNIVKKIFVANKILNIVIK